MKTKKRPETGDNTGSPNAPNRFQLALGLLGNEPVYYRDAQDEYLSSLYAGRPTGFEFGVQGVGTTSSTWQGWSWSAGIPGRAGLYHAPNIYPRHVRERMDEALVATGTGLRSDDIRFLVSVFGEADHITIEEQAALLDHLEAYSGIRGVGVLSGDHRPESWERAGVWSRRVRLGKSIHYQIPVFWIDTSDANAVAAWERAGWILTVVLRGDISVRDRARKLRMGGAERDGRVQTLLCPGQPMDVFELVELLEGYCETFGIDIDAGREALVAADKARHAAKSRDRAMKDGQLPEGATADQAAAEATRLRELATVMTEHRCVSDDIRAELDELPKWTKRFLKGRNGRRSCKTVPSRFSGGMRGVTDIDFGTYQVDGVPLDVWAERHTPASGPSPNFGCPIHSGSGSAGRSAAVYRDAHGGFSMTCFSACGCTYRHRPGAPDPDLDTVARTEPPSGEDPPVRSCDAWAEVLVALGVPCELHKAVVDFATRLGASAPLVRRAPETDSGHIDGPALTDLMRTRVNVLLGRLGTGKTTAARQVRGKTSGRVVVAAPYCALASSLATRMNVANYRDASMPKGGLLPVGASVAVATPSLHRAAMWRPPEGVPFGPMTEDPVHMLYLDEVEQQVRCLRGGHLSDHQALRAWDSLLLGLGQAEQVVLSDADVGPATLILMIAAGVTGETTIWLGPEAKKRRFVELPGRNEWLREIAMRWAAGEKLYIAVRSEKLAEQVASMLRLSGNGRLVRMVTAECSADVDLSDPDSWAYVHALVATPVLGSGIDLAKRDHFDAAFLWMENMVGSVDDALQHVSRVRHLSSGTVYYAGKGGTAPGPEHTNPETIIRRWQARARTVESEAETSPTGSGAIRATFAPA